MSQTLYDKYGGGLTVSAIVYGLYRRIRQSSAWNKYFQGVDTNQLIRHQTNFVSVALGGREAYSGRAMEAAHKHLGISNGEFDAVAGMLKEALEERCFEPGDVQAVLGVVGGLRGQIVSSSEISAA